MEKVMTEKIKRYVVSKRFLYALCFIALFVIDWTRGSQAGAIWAWTINMTGVVMAVIVFSACRPKEFLKPVYIIYSVVGILALMAAHHWWMQNQTAIFRDQLLTAILNIWLLGIFVLKFILDAAIYKVRKIRCSKIEILAAVMLLWMLFSVNEDIWPGWYLVMFCLFYHTEYNKGDMEALKQGMLDGIIAAFFLLQGAAFVFRPYDIVRYAGIYNNCNINALFYGIVWVAFLIRMYDIRKKNGKKWKEVLCFLFAGALAAFSLMTGCRTAWLAMFATGFIYVIFADFQGLKYKAGKMFGKLVLYAVVVCVSFPITFAAARYIPPVFHHPIWYDWEYSISRVHSFDPWDSEKYVSWEDLTDQISGRIKPFVKKIFGGEQAGIATVQASNFTIGDKTYDTSSQEYEDYGSVLVRLAFWDYYLRNGNMEGHLTAEGHEVPGFYYVWHTQNTFIQFWYYYGIPSAVLFLIVMISLVFIGMKRMVKGQDDALICLLYLVFWGMYGLAEAVWYPGQMILFLAFFTPKFLWQKEKETPRQDA
ncbi:hypothetical protein D7X98_14875 [bacterium 1XD8-76]|nr:hypothetical protein D7X98_14875 [bacterium 1XD8-76]